MNPPPTEEEFKALSARVDDHGTRITSLEGIYVRLDTLYALYAGLAAQFAAGNAELNRVIGRLEKATADAERTANEAEQTAQHASVTAEEASEAIAAAGSAIPSNTPPSLRVVERTVVALSKDGWGRIFFGATLGVLATSDLGSRLWNFVLNLIP